MTLVLGTNCGFVTTAPTTDPGGTNNGAMSTKANGFRVTTPAIHKIRITEMGWYVNAATNDANTQMGIYTSDGTDENPDDLIESTGDFSKGTTEGWVKKTDLNIILEPSTTYWICAQCDISADTYVDIHADATQAYNLKNDQTELPDPWDGSVWSLGYLAGFYALYEVVYNYINIGDVWKEVKAIKINIEDTWKTVSGMQINSNGSEWSTVF